jgi:hypothetical protein
MVIRPPPEITDDDLSNVVPKVNNGHTRKIINRSIMTRRHMVYSMLSRGMTTYQCAEVLRCSQSTISSDEIWLRNFYKQNILSYISDELPMQWHSCLTALHSTMAAVSAIIEDPATSTHDRLHAHTLMVNCIEVKEELISDPTIIQEALDIVDQTKKRIVEISQEKSKELLHMEGEGKEVQATQQRQEEESEEHQEEEQQKQKTNNSIF